MHFSQQRLFAYNRSLFKAANLDGLEELSTADTDFHLSGLEDLASVLSIAQEYFTQFPTVTVKELARGIDGQTQAVDPVYGEPVVNARYQFSRTISINSYVSFADPTKTHGKRGETLTQPITAAFCLQDLHDLDYFPDLGDQLIFNGRLYDMCQIIIKATDYFQNTMAPLYIHSICGLHQFGDRLPPQTINNPNPPILGESPSTSVYPDAGIPN